jgi:plastocyanin
METQTIRPETVSRRRLAVVAALVVLALAAGAAFLFLRPAPDPGPPVTGVTEVAVGDDVFAPAAIAVPAGTTVTWRWEGEEEHNVVGAAFESPTQTTGDFAYEFAAPGTYDYRCTLHRSMVGRVVVQ